MPRAFTVIPTLSRKAITPHRTGFKSPNDVLPRTLYSHRKVAVFSWVRFGYSGKACSGAPCAAACAGVWPTFISHDTITK